MTIAAFAMNALLALLLLAALAFGWRLERRLKALRDSHEGFAKAVAELDAAAQRAEQGLADLRAAADEAAGTLTDRIEKARALAGRLEGAVGDEAPTPNRLQDAPVRQPPRETPKSRARVDDELFEPDAPSLRSIPGGRR